MSVIGHNATNLSHHELMTRGPKGILQVFELDVSIIVAMKGWAIGGLSNALFCVSCASRPRRPSSCSPR